MKNGLFITIKVEQKFNDFGYMITDVSESINAIESEYNIDTSKPPIISVENGYAFFTFSVNEKVKLETKRDNIEEWEFDV